MGYFVEAFLRAGYGASMSKLDYEYKNVKRRGEVANFEKEKRRQLEKYIYKLKADGLIDFLPDRKIKLSKKGKTKAKDLHKIDLFDMNAYRKKKGQRVIIVSYDLPIKYNRERDKLREVLKVLGFRMIHKSVWVGRVRLPEKLIKGLDKMKLLHYIEILEVTKQGSLKPI